MAQPCRPARLRDMTEPETAWLAGILEGEGSFMVWPTKGTRRNVVRVQMGTTDKDVLDRVAAIVGVGTVRAVTHQLNKLGSKPMWIWCVGSKADARELAVRVMPWLGERRRGQAEAIIAATADIVTRPEGVCMNGHDIAGENAAFTGRSFACKRCVSERRKRQARERRAHASNQTL